MRLNQNGLSLIEITIAAALTAVVALGAAFVVSRSQQAAHFATVQNDIDRVHYLNIQAARNVDHIQKSLGIDPKEADALQDPKLLGCLQAKPSTDGSSCLDYNQSSVSLKSDYLFQDPDHNIQSTVSLKPHCVTMPSGLEGCDAIVVTVNTSYAGAAGSFVSRNSVSNMPNYLFIPRNDIAYNCQTSGDIMIGIDYYNQVPLCTGHVTGGSGTTNTDELPLIVYDSGIDSWSAPNTVSCPSGYISVGFGTAVCRGSLNLTVLPTTTTTSTLPSPTSTVPPGPTTTSTTIPTGPGHWVYDGATPTVIWGDSYMGPGSCGLAPYPCSDGACSNLKSYIASAGQTFTIGAGSQMKTYQCGGVGGRAAGNTVGVQVCLASGPNVNKTVTNGSWICTIP